MPVQPVAPVPTETSPTAASHDQAGPIDLLAVGLGTTVAMWAVGYVGHMPLTGLPTSVFVGLMLACLIAGGAFAGRYTRRGLAGGLWVGLISATVNLLILGSLLVRPTTQEFVPGVWLWLPGWFLLSTTLATAGAAVGRLSARWGSLRSTRPTGFRRPGTSARAKQSSTTYCLLPTARCLPPSAFSPNWLGGLAWITAVAAMLLIVAGGLVTGFRAGMAVPDWPGTFGSNMFLYPVEKMTGGIFYEHAHRLLGTLVGLCNLTLAVYLLVAVPGRRRLTAFTWLVGVCVAIQGIMGGFRVTDDSHCLAAVHGFFAHAVLGGLVAVAVMLSRPWQQRADVRVRPSAGADHLFTALLVAVVLLQALLGTLVRQLGLSLMAHVGAAAVVALVTVAAGVRAWGLNPGRPIFQRCGTALLGLVLVQFTLGVVALIYRTPPVGTSPSAEELLKDGGALPITPLPALLTTTHQATAAVILVVAVVLAVWTWRMVQGGQEDDYPL